MVDRLTWRMVKFTALQGGPAYTDLGEVAAVLDTAEPHANEWPTPMLAVAHGATIYLKSGARYYVRETADIVFEEVHRFRVEQQPPPPKTKLADSAPAATVGGEPGPIDG